MSKLSELFRRYQRSRVVEALVEYMETVDIPGPAKKAIVTSILKTLHIKSGGEWDAEVRRAIEGGIEYVLAEVREWARRNDPTPDDDPNKAAGDGLVTP